MRIPEKMFGWVGTSKGGTYGVKTRLEPTCAGGLGRIELRSRSAVGGIGDIEESEDELVDIRG